MNDFRTTLIQRASKLAVMLLDSADLRRIAALVIVSMVIVFIAAIRASWPEDQSMHGPPSLSSANAAEAYVLGEPLDLNRASPEAIAMLPGIGPKLAARISARAPFRSIEELDAVQGVGPALYAMLRSEAIIRAPTSPPDRRETPAPTKIARAE